MPGKLGKDEYQFVLNQLRHAHFPVDEDTVNIIISLRNPDRICTKLKFHFHVDPEFHRLKTTLARNLQPPPGPDFNAGLS